MLNDPSAIVAAFMQAVTDDDDEAVRQLTSPDVVMVESATLPGAYRGQGHDALERYGRGWKRNWAQWRWTPLESIVCGDRVLVRATLWLEGLRSGAAVEREWYYVFETAAGKLTAQVGFDDRESALRALYCADPLF